MPDIPVLKTRKPTGKPPWPMILLAGAEKCGKSYAAAAFSASDLIDRTFFVELGEGYADHYGAIPGARYEIVEHDGTYLSLGRQLRAATLQPRPNGKPHAIVLDTATELWDLLSEEAQGTANRRKKKDADGEAQITMDLWNVAKKRWRRIVDLLRQYDGPVIITARLEQVAVMGPDGKTPTAAKEWKVRAEKNLPFECDVVVKMPEQGRAILTGVRSLLLRTGSGLEVTDFSVEKLLTSMGIVPGQTQARSYTAPTAEAAAEQQPQQEQPDRRTEIVASAGQRRQERPDALVKPPADEPDPWATEPPAEPKSLHEQHVQISELFHSELGVTDRKEKVKRLGDTLGRELTSTTELTHAEAENVIARMVEFRHKRLEREQLIADFRAEIEGAESFDALAAIGGRIALAVERGRLSKMQTDTAFEDVWVKRQAELTEAQEPVGASS